MLTVAAHLPTSILPASQHVGLRISRVRGISSMMLIMVNKQDYVNWDQSSDFHGHSIVPLASQGQKSAEMSDRYKGDSGLEK